MRRLISQARTEASPQRGSRATMWGHRFRHPGGGYSPRVIASGGSAGARRWLLGGVNAARCVTRNREAIRRLSGPRRDRWP